MDTFDARRRAERREFIRTAHPDRGGDPDEFVAGLRRFDAPAAQAAGEPPPRVFVVASPRWPVSLVSRAVRGIVRRHRLKRRRRVR